MIAFHVPQAELALRSLHIEGPKLQQLLASAHQTPPTSPLPTSQPQHMELDLLEQYRQHGLTFDQFCCIYAELKYILLRSENFISSSSSHLLNYLATPLRWIVSE
jgi:hypothetical protein